MPPTLLKNIQHQTTEQEFQTEIKFVLDLKDYKGFHKHINIYSVWPCISRVNYSKTQASGTGEFHLTAFFHRSSHPVVHWAFLSQQLSHGGDGQQDLGYFNTSNKAANSKASHVAHVYNIKSYVYPGK